MFRALIEYVSQDEIRSLQELSEADPQRYICFSTEPHILDVVHMYLGATNSRRHEFPFQITEEPVSTRTYHFPCGEVTIDRRKPNYNNYKPFKWDIAINGGMLVLTHFSDTKELVPFLRELATPDSEFASEAITKWSYSEQRNETVGLRAVSGRRCVYCMSPTMRHAGQLWSLPKVSHGIPMSTSWSQGDGWRGCFTCCPVHKACLVDDILDRDSHDLWRTPQRCLVCGQRKKKRVRRDD